MQIQSLQSNFYSIDQVAPNAVQSEKREEIGHCITCLFLTIYEFVSFLFSSILSCEFSNSEAPPQPSISAPSINVEEIARGLLLMMQQRGLALNAKKPLSPLLESYVEVIRYLLTNEELAEIFINIRFMKELVCFKDLEILTILIDLARKRMSPEKFEELAMEIRGILLGDRYSTDFSEIIRSVLSTENLADRLPEVPPFRSLIGPSHS
jgi:hypothetical protein